MLSLLQRKSLFFELLQQENGSYGDIIKNEIEFYFSCSDGEFKFLSKLQTQQEISDFIQMLVSKIILHEHEDGINSLIEYYCY